MIDLEGRNYGPGRLHLTPDRIADFVESTGDDPDRWEATAPPGFAASALFVVAPDLLGEVVGSVIHGEQTFTWHGPLRSGSVLDVIGTVSRVRERGGVHYIGFDISAADGGTVILDGSSLFLVTGEALPVSSDFERREPPHSYRGDPGDGQLAASRADLIRYAAATRDWNPIHWDHDAAVAAGLPGVVVHGLLQASWALAAVARLRTGEAPVSSAKIRFRSPLLPARPVDLDLGSDGDSASVTISDVDNEYLNARVTLSEEDADG